MKKIIGLFVLSLFLFGGAATAQEAESYTGTIMSFGSGFDTRTVTRTFTLNITGQTSDEQAQKFLGILRQDGQDTLLKNITTQTLGNFSLGGQLGRDVNVVRESTVDGKRRIFVVFERWIQFAEIRGGYRSLDYPFSVIELFIDEKTGNGEGSYIPAARIRWDLDDKTKKEQVEILNFATFPSKVIGVKLRKNRSSK